jgi:hypothetical protein
MAEGAEATPRRPTTPLAAEVFTLRLTILGKIPSVAAGTPDRPFELGSLALQLETTISNNHSAADPTFENSMSARSFCRPAS